MWAKGFTEWVNVKKLLQAVKIFGTGSLITGWMEQ